MNQRRHSSTEIVEKKLVLTREKAKEKYIQQRVRREREIYGRKNRQDLFLMGFNIEYVRKNASETWDQMHPRWNDSIDTSEEHYEVPSKRRALTVTRSTDINTNNNDGNPPSSSIVMEVDKNEGENTIGRNNRSDVSATENKHDRISNLQCHEQEHDDRSSVVRNMYNDDEVDNNVEEQYDHDDNDAAGEGGVDDSENSDNVDSDGDDDNSDGDDDDSDGDADSEDGGDDGGDGDDDDENDENGTDSDSEGKIFSLTSHFDQLLAPIRANRGTTYLMALLSILTMAIRHNLMYTVIVSMLRSAASLYRNFPIATNKKSLWRFLSRNDKAATKRHYYCQSCWTIVGNTLKSEKDCPCGKSGPGKDTKNLAYFIQLKIESQLRYLFSDLSIVESLKYRFTRVKRDEEKIEDIYDSSKYKRLCLPGRFLANPWNFTFGLFIDGASVAKSANTSAWPIMLMIYELSPHARKKYMILAGIWVGRGHPSIHTLMMPIIDELNYLYETGMTWKMPDTEIEVTSKFLLLTCTADTIARPMVLNMTQFNGYYGCTFCYHKGEQFVENVVITTKHIYPFENRPSPIRTHQEIRRDMMLAARSDERVNGVCGYGAIACILGFNLSHGMPVDSMHNVFLGVAKFYTELCMKNSGQHRWNCGGALNLTTINNRLLSMRPPSRISRTPRRIEDHPQWKASEWRNWLLYYALICLEGILPDRYHTHLALFCNAVYILNKDGISTEELQLARRSLIDFVRDFQALFGEQYMRYNIHLLTHLTQTVENWGPLWTTSAFPYESWNKKIIEKASSPNSRALQIVTRFLLTRFVESLFNDPRISTATKRMMNVELTSGLKKKDYVIDATPVKPLRFLAKNRKIDRSLKNSEIEALRRVGYEIIQNSVTFYETAVLCGTMTYQRTPTDNRKQTKVCDEFLHYGNKKYGRIVEIISFTDAENDNARISGFMVAPLRVTGNAFGTNHIKTVTELSENEFLPITNDAASMSIVPAIFLGRDSRGRQLIAKLANVNETD